MIAVDKWMQVYWSVIVTITSLACEGFSAAFMGLNFNCCMGYIDKLIYLVLALIKLHLCTQYTMLQSKVATMHACSDYKSLDQISTNI